MKTTHKILGIFPEYQIKTYPLEVRVKTNIEGLKVQSKDVEKDKEAVVATTKFVPTSYQVTGKTDLGSLDIKVTTDVKQAKDNKVVLSLLTNTYEIQASLPKDISNPTNIKLFANDKEITTNLTKDIKLVDNQEVTIYATFVYENATYKTKKISLTADPETHIIEAKLALDEEAQSKIKKTQKEREHKEAQEQKERETRENIESFADSNLKVTKKGLDLMAIQLGDYSNIAGRWSDGQKTIDFAQELTKFTSATDVTVTSKLKGNSLEFLMQPDVGVGSFAYLIYPAGTATMDLKGARIANSDDMSKDRILVMHEVYGSFFYRESHSGGTDTKNSVNDFTGIEADLESFMNAYRSAVNKTISTKKDYMADLYVSKENPAYEETLGWFLDANEPYQNVSTKSFSNIQEEGDTISFDVLIDNNGTDSKRFYKLKKVKDGYKILEFRY